MPKGRLVAAELLKVRKRWLPYVLLLLMLLGVGFQIWVVGYLSWRSNDAEFGAAALRSFVLPWSLAAILDSGQYWGSVLVGIFTASIVATEYNWGTVRQALVRGQTRSDYLTLKLVGIAIIAVAGLAVALAAGLLFSIIASAMADQPITFDVPGGPSAPEAFLMVLRAGYCILPYGFFAFCITIIGRSTTMGVGGTIFFVLGDSILKQILVGIGGAAADVAAFLPAQNVSAVMAANRIGAGDVSGLALRDSSVVASALPDPAVAALVLAVYCAAFLAIAYFVFNRRDLTAGAGGS
ncbi:MAG: ABC transporter permease subunit [Chloroflexi bacterium]|nr:ABC transporter permease subunit [Chloroflexota bacterium]